MKLIKKILTIGTVVLLSACAEMQSAEQQAAPAKPAATQADSAAAAKTAIEKAEQAQAAANAVGYEWRDTAKLIKQAKAAAKKKIYPAAIELANRAQAQGEKALAQYHDQKDAGMMN